MPRDQSKKGRVLFVTSNFPRWAGDSTTPFILHLAQDLRDLGWQINVLAPHAPGAAFSESFDGISVRRFRYLWPTSAQTVCYQGGALANLRRDKFNYLKLPALVAAETLAIHSALWRGKYDIVHSHWILPQGFAATLPTRLHSVPHVISAHGGDVFSLRGAVLNKVKRVALEHADAVTANSSATEQAILDLAPMLKTLQRIPEGASQFELDSRQVAELREQHRWKDGPSIVFVGRLVEEKGVADLLRATSLLVERLPGISVLIIGDGPDSARFSRMADELSIANRVKFVGWLQPDGVAHHLASADIFVGPSKKSVEGWVEAQGITFSEALLAGIPVVATRSGGIPDVIRDKETGLLVPESSPDDIAEAITLLATNEQLAQKLARRGRQVVLEKFTRSVTSKQFSELFEALIEGR